MARSLTCTLPAHPLFDFGASVPPTPIGVARHILGAMGRISHEQARAVTNGGTQPVIVEHVYDVTFDKWSPPVQGELSGFESKLDQVISRYNDLVSSMTRVHRDAGAKPISYSIPAFPPLPRSGASPGRTAARRILREALSLRLTSRTAANTTQGLAVLLDGVFEATVDALAALSRPFPIHLSLTTDDDLRSLTCELGFDENLAVQQVFLQRKEMGMAVDRRRGMETANHARAVLISHSLALAGLVDLLLPSPEGEIIFTINRRHQEDTEVCVPLFRIELGVGGSTVSDVVANARVLGDNQIEPIAGMRVTILDDSAPGAPADQPAQRGEK